MPRDRAVAVRPSLGEHSQGGRPYPVLSRRGPRGSPPAPPPAQALTGCPEAQATKLTVSASHTPRIIPAKAARRPPGAGHKGETGGRRRSAAPAGRGAGPRAPSGPPRFFRSSPRSAPPLPGGPDAARRWGAQAASLRAADSAALPPSAPSARRRRRGSQLNPAEIPAGLQHRLAAPPASGRRRRAAAAGSRPSQIQATFPPPTPPRCSSSSSAPVSPFSSSPPAENTSSAAG